jgi:hypothetical protein
MHLAFAGLKINGAILLARSSHLLSGICSFGTIFRMKETVKALNLLDRANGAYYWHLLPKGVPEACALAAKPNVPWCASAIWPLYDNSKGLGLLPALRLWMWPS